MSTEILSSPGEPLWHALATRPDIIEIEQRITEHAVLAVEANTSHNEAENYWWNSGTPYVLMTGGARFMRNMPGEGGSSYDNDYPEGYEQSSPTARNPQPLPPEAEGQRYKNDVQPTFTQFTSTPKQGVRIATTPDGQQYLVNQDGKVMSAGYPSISYFNGHFVTPPGPYMPATFGGQLHVLDDAGREHAYLDRARHQALARIHYRNEPGRQKLQAAAAHTVLAEYGVRPEAVVETHIPNRRPDDTATVLTFPYNEKQVEVRIKRTGMEVTTWNPGLTPDYYLESGGEIDEQFLCLQIVGNYPTRTMPVAMELITLPPDQQRAVLGVSRMPEPSNVEEGDLPRSYHLLAVDRPGEFTVRNGGDVTYRLAADGMPQRIGERNLSQPGAHHYDTPPADPALNSALQAVEASIIIASDTFRAILTSEEMTVVTLDDPLVREQLSLPPMEFATRASDSSPVSVGELLDRVGQALAIIHATGRIASDVTITIAQATASIQGVFEGTRHHGDLPAVPALSKAASHLGQVIVNLQAGLEHLQNYRGGIQGHD